MRALQKAMLGVCLAVLLPISLSVASVSVPQGGIAAAPGLGNDFTIDVSNGTGENGFDLKISVIDPNGAIDPNILITSIKDETTDKINKYGEFNDANGQNPAHTPTNSADKPIGSWPRRIHIKLKAAGITNVNWKFFYQMTSDNGSLIAQNNAESEPNNSLAFAQRLDEGDISNATIGSLSDVDWYSLDTTAGDNIQVSATGFASMTLVVYANDGVTVLGTGTGSQSTVRTGPVLPGKVYVKVSATTTGTYSIGAAVVGSAELSQVSGLPTMPVWAAGVLMLMLAAAAYRVLRQKRQEA